MESMPRVEDLPLDEYGATRDIVLSSYLWAHSLKDRHSDGNLDVVSLEEAREILGSSSVKIEANPLAPQQVFDYTAAFLGKEEFSNFVGDIKSFQLDNGWPAISAVSGRLRAPKQGVVLTTDHENIMDIAIAKNGIYCAFDDPELASQSALIINEAAALLTYAGVPIIDIMRATGDVYLTRPGNSDSAKRFGIIERLSQPFNRRMLNELIRDSRLLAKQNKSMLLAAALTGATAKKNPPQGPTQEIILPNVDPVTAHLMLKYFRFALPISMYIDNLKKGKRWYDLRPINVFMRESQIDETINDMGGALSEMARVPVYYKGRQSKIGSKMLESAGLLGVEGA